MIKRINILKRYTIIVDSYRIFTIFFSVSLVKDDTIEIKKRRKGDLSKMEEKISENSEVSADVNMSNSDENGNFVVVSNDDDQKNEALTVENEQNNEKVSENEDYSFDATVNISADESLKNVTENTKNEENTEGTESNSEAQRMVENTENSSSAVKDDEFDESSEVLEYATMPGSFASYQAEQQNSSGNGNGVYPENDLGRANGVYPENGNGRTTGGMYFGSYNGNNSYNQNGGYYSQNSWQNGYPSSQPQKSSKKRFALFGAIGAVALVLIVSAAIGIFQIVNGIMMNGLDGVTPPASEQGGGSGQEGSGSSGGGSANGGSSSGGALSGGSSSGISAAVTEALQNGSFELQQSEAGESKELTTVYQLTESSVVAIKSNIGSGSGVIIAKDEKNNDGFFIVTNNHVVEDGTNYKVTVSNGTEYDAILIGRDENTDLAILKIVATDLSISAVGRSDDLLVAEEVLLIGNPLGMFGGTATNGIISGKNRTLTIDGYTMSLLQTNAAVNNGNSGGGMFNMSGQLVGIVNAKFVDEAVEGIGFAIPIDIAKPIIEDLINYGYVKGRASLGFSVAYGINRIELRYDYYVSELQTGSSAALAGLKINDIVRGIKVNGVNYIGEDLSAYLKSLKVGDVLEITVRRYARSDFGYTPDDKVITFTVTEIQG